MSIEVRNVHTEDEFDRWSDAIDIGFQTPQNRETGGVGGRGIPISAGSGPPSTARGLWAPSSACRWN